MPGDAFSLAGIVKTFPGVHALDGASLSIRPGEIHGLVGENGAGKSTIIKILAGVYRPDQGTISINAEPVPSLTPTFVHKAGVRFIHQELHLVPHFTVTESVFMGQELTGRLGLAKRDMRKKAEAFLRNILGIDLPGNLLVRDLGTAERKLVQIARALIDGKAKTVVFDEPTAPLASDEVETVMKAINALKAEGIAILYVSHYLSEVTDICDRVTVFRQGKTVGVFDQIDADSSGDLIYAMVGRNLTDMFPQKDRKSRGIGLEVSGFGDGERFEGVSLKIQRGQILGIAGLIGSGREELVEALYGLRSAKSGSMRIEGEVTRIRNAAQAVRAGLVLVPRDRRNAGLVLPMTVSENVTLAILERNSRFSLEDRNAARKTAAEQIGALDIRPPNPDAVTRFLSGGNQQKVVLARWLAKTARVFIFDEPTLGVDIGAKAEIYRLIENLARDGAAVIVSSSDPVELVGICDRIAIMMRGRMAGELSATDLTVDGLVAATTGAADVGTLADAVA
ncbi:MAG: sugar ABC transporter ATP-binding protein [Rhodobacter sp.]|nr:sugar ABC transporter ATP-binding protein [Rhodobacter sp.]